MKQLSCNQCRERWDELINKSTLEADAQIAEVRTHLESCAECRKMFDLLVANRQELQHLSSLKAPASMRATILNQIEKPQKQFFHWLNSPLISPHRLAWASGAIVAVFMVALLMRPERQTQVLQTTPNVLSNRAQVEEHSNAYLRRSLTSAKPQLHATAKKVLPGKSREIKSAKLSPKTQLKKSVNPKPAELSKHSPKPTTPAPKATLGKNSASSGKPAIKSLRKPKPQESAAPEAPSLTVPTPMNNDSATNEQSRNNVARFNRSTSEHSASQPRSANHSNSASQSRTMNRSLSHEAHEREGQVSANSAFRSQKSLPIIHWTKSITSDYDVANAKITVTLGEGLSFAGDAENESERTLLQGRIYRGKEIPLSLELRRTSEEGARLHLLMIDIETQKVLLDKYFDFN